MSVRSKDYFSCLLPSSHLQKALGCMAKSTDPEQPISNSPDLHPTDLILQWLIVVIILHHVALKMCVRPLLEKITNWLKMALDIFFFFSNNSLVAVSKKRTQKKLSSVKQSNSIFYTFLSLRMCTWRKLTHIIMVNNNKKKYSELS